MKGGRNKEHEWEGKQIGGLTDRWVDMFGWKDTESNFRVDEKV